MSVPYKAVGDNVVASIVVKKKTKSGLYLPTKDMNDKRSLESEDIEFKVESVGEEVKRILAVDDIIYLDRGFGVPLPILEEDSKKYMAINERYIVAVKS